MTSGSPAIARKVGSQSWCWMISLEIGPGFDLARPAHQHRDAERAFPVGVLLAAERGHAAVRPRVHVRAVVGRIHDEGIVGDAELIEEVEHLADVLVMVDHGVVIGRLPPSRLAQALGLGVGEDVHVGEVEPDEERLARIVLASSMNSFARGDEIVVAGLHALGGQRAGILDLLLADPAPARLLGRIVDVGRPGVHDAARAELLAELREILFVGIVVHLRLFLGVEVVEVAVELVEAVVGRQHRG